MKSISGSALLGLLLMAGGAAAQTVVAPPVPNAILSLPQVRKTPSPPAQVEEQLQLPAADFSPIKFQKVHIVGANALPASDIAADFDRLAGKAVTAADMRSALDAVRQRYAKANYALGRAYIPAQQMKDGVLTVRVLEGYIGTVVVNTDTPRIKDNIARYAGKLLAEKPLRGDDLDRYLRLMAEIPGVTLSARLTDMNLQTGAVGLILTVDYQPIGASAVLGSRGNVRGLPVQPYLTLKANDLIGMDDQFSLTGLVSSVPKDEYFVQGAGSVGLDSDGWRLGMVTSLSRARANILPASINLSSSQLRSEINTSYPLIKQATEQMTISGGSYFSQLHYDLNHMTIARDRGMAAYIDLSEISQISPKWSGSATGRITMGFQLPYIPSVPQSRANATRDFAKIDLSGALAYAATSNLSVLLRGDAQAASGSLTAGEEASYGADRFGRGYDTGLISGDGGVGVSLQPQYSFTVAPEWNAAAFLFGDFAQVINTSGDLQGNSTLLSTGLGASLSHGIYSGTLGLAEPLRQVRGYNVRLSPRLFGGLQIRL